MSRSFSRILATGLALAAVAAPAMLVRLDAGQTTTSLFPAYDGFVRNEDGSLLLTFAYFNHNRTTVTVPWWSMATSTASCAGTSPMAARAGLDAAWMRPANGGRGGTSTPRPRRATSVSIALPSSGCSAWPNWARSGTE